MFTQVKPISLILTAVLAGAILSWAVPAFAEPPAPRLTLKALQKSYPLGAPVTLQYALLGAKGIPQKPFSGFCRVGVSDFRLDFVVRIVPGGTLSHLPSPYVGVPGIGLFAADWRKRREPEEAILNEWVWIFIPGRYTVMARVTVLRPAGKIKTLWSDPVTITVTDGARERRARQERIAHVTRLLSRPASPPNERQAAVRSLRFIYRDEALTPLLVAFNDCNMGVHEEAEEALLSWPYPFAVLPAARARLKFLAAQPGEIRTSQWANLLSVMQLCDDNGYNPVDGEEQAASVARAKREVIRILTEKLPALSPGAAGERRMEILLLNDVTPTAETLLLLFRAASQMNADGQERLTFVLGQWEKRPAPSVLRPLKRELERLARNAAVSVSLRQVARNLVTHLDLPNAPFLRGASDEKSKSLFTPGNRL